MKEAKDALYSRLSTIGNIVHVSVPVDDNEVSVFLSLCMCACFFFLNGGMIGQTCVLCFLVVVIVTPGQNSCTLIYFLK